MRLVKAHTEAAGTDCHPQSATDLGGLETTPVIENAPIRAPAGGLDRFNEVRPLTSRNLAIVVGIQRVSLEDT